MARKGRERPSKGKERTQGRRRVCKGEKKGNVHRASVKVCSVF
jgi:hypothetical protein